MIILLRNSQKNFKYDTQFPLGDCDPKKVLRTTHQKSSYNLEINWNPDN